MQPSNFNNKQMFSRYLSSDGTTSGVKDMSTTADTYYFTATAPCKIYRMIVTYTDGTGAVISEYGNLNAALSTGIEVKLVRSGGAVLVDLTDGVPVKTNGDWIRLCYDYSFQNHGNGDDYFGVRWTFANSGKPLVLAETDRLEFIVGDDLTELTAHYAVIQGFYT